ncbi:MAG: hypothetical protein ACI90V_009873 [Bacillariaceae sp.]|jgi:hypothetical protein
MVASLLPQTTMAFTTSSLSRDRGGRSSIVTTRPSSESSSTKLFFFGQAKDDGSPGDYVCKDVRVHCSLFFVVTINGRRRRRRH